MTNLKRVNSDLYIAVPPRLINVSEDAFQFSKIEGNLCICKCARRLQTRAIYPTCIALFRESPGWGMNRYFVLLHALLGAIDGSLGILQKVLRLWHSRGLQLAELVWRSPPSLLNTQMLCWQEINFELRLAKPFKGNSGNGRNTDTRKEIYSRSRYQCEAMVELCVYHLFIIH